MRYALEKATRLVKSTFLVSCAALLLFAGLANAGSNALTVTVSPLYPQIYHSNSVTFNAIVVGGTPPYAYQWYSNAACSMGGFMGGKVTNSLTISLNNGYGAYNFCVSVKDSANAVVTAIDTAYAISFATPVLQASITSSANVVDVSQSVTLTANVIGGVPPYAYQWYAGRTPNAGCVDFDGGAISNVLTTQLNNGYGSFEWCVQVTDSANTMTEANYTISVVSPASTTTTSVTTVSPTTSVNATTTVSIGGPSTSVSPTPLTGAIGACPFNISLSAPYQFYLSPPSIAFHYTAATTGSCAPTAPFSGKISLFYNRSLSATETLPVPVPQLQLGKTNGTISINSTNLAPGVYGVQFYFYSSNYQNSGTASFYIIKPAELLITNFTVQPASVTLGSSPSLIQDLSNIGGLGSTNTTLNIGISGPNGFYNVIHQKLGTIGKGNAQTVITQLAGDGVVSGMYSVNDNVSFSSNLTASNVTYRSGTLFSNTQKGVYTVLYNASSAYNFSGGLPVPPSKIGPISILSLPVYTRVLIGNTTTGYLGVANAKNSTVSMIITTPNVSYGKLTTSIKSFFVNEGTSEYVQFVFVPYMNATPGIYTDPIRISADYLGAITNGTVYLVFDIEKKSSAVVNFDMQEEMMNYGKNLGVSIDVYNPTSRALNNTVMYVKFPSFAAPTNDILLTGVQANETASGGETSLEWLMSFIQPGRSVQLGYSVSNVTDLPLLLGPFTNLASTSGSTAPTFTLINMAPEKLVLGENVTLTVSGLYQGAYQSGVTLRLSSTSANVVDPVQIIPNVMQSQIISVPFTIVPATIGNSTLDFSVKGQGINKTYSIPLIITQKYTALTRFVDMIESNVQLLVATALVVALLLALLQVATEALPKSILIEQCTESTSNAAMRKYNYDHVFELLSKPADEKENKMRLKCVPVKWGIFTPLNKRDVRIINDSGHLTIYTRGAVANKLKACLKLNKLQFVALMTK